MIRVYCRTNLDLSHEEWPDYLPVVPSVGDHIRSKVKHGTFQLELEVHSVTWVFMKNALTPQERDCWVPEIELHMTSFHRGLPAKHPHAATGSITAFYEWYAPLVGRSVGAFI